MCPHCGNAETITTDEYIWHCPKCTRHELRPIEPVKPMTQELKSNQLKQGQKMVECVCTCGAHFRRWESSAHTLCTTCRAREHARRWRERNPERYAELLEKRVEERMAKREKYESRTIVCPDCKKEFITRSRDIKRLIRCPECRHEKRVEECRVRNRLRKKLKSRDPSAEVSRSAVTSLKTLNATTQEELKQTYVAVSPGVGSGNPAPLKDTTSRRKP